MSQIWCSRSRGTNSTLFEPKDLSVYSSYELDTSDERNHSINTDSPDRNRMVDPRRKVGPAIGQDAGSACLGSSVSPICGTVAKWPKA